MNDFKKGSQHITNIVRDEKGDLVTDFNTILIGWRNHFSQLFSVHGVNDVRQRKIHSAEPLVPESSAFEVEMAIVKPKNTKHLVLTITQKKLIKAGGRTIRSEIHKL